ncbi:hypothetical protein, partial [Sphingobacterium siyangense]|uniref:hypothetical protein n=1 Tax=Sphingobacterium siyangense TaxID=459529 RepID=UPI003DA34DFF
HTFGLDCVFISAENAVLQLTNYAAFLFTIYNSPFLRVDLNVEFTKHACYSIYEITPKKGTHTAVRVKQKGVETDIFNDQIALVFSRPSEIKIELIVRSNEFPNGPKTFNYSFSEDQIQEILDPRDL